MSIAILLVTHGQIGQSFLETALYILKEPINVSIMNLAITEPEMSLEHLSSKIQTCCNRLNQGQGVLVLTDLVGATPYNSVVAVCHSKHNYPLESITGLNLAMLLTIINEISLYPALSLTNLVEKAEEGGRRSIIVPT